MGYSVTVNPDHVYVQYHGVLKGLDIVKLIADPDFINDLRRLGRVVHDASSADAVSITPEQMREIGVLLSIESNFTEELLGIIVPNDGDGFERLQKLKESVKSKQWTIFLVHTYQDALDLLDEAEYLSH